MTDQDEQVPHRPVLYQEIIYALQPTSPGRYVDATLGAGGHAAAILEHSSPDGQLLGFDRDPAALAIALQRLRQFGSRAILVQASHRDLTKQLQDIGWGEIQGLVMDLGVSSMQLDTPGRGFSFQSDGPLDMRFDPAAPFSAADLVNTVPEQELSKLIFEFGEEQHSRRIARAIVASRPLRTTRQLAEVIRQAVPGERGKIHPATRTFQAIRIAVNEELAALADTLPQAVAALAPGSRMAVISFHSLEDRIVKQFMRRESRDCICPPEQLVCTCGHLATIKEVNRRPITASPAEIDENPRARSAKLRVAEKLPLA